MFDEQIPAKEYQQLAASSFLRYDERAIVQMPPTCCYRVGLPGEKFFELACRMLHPS